MNIASHRIPMAEGDSFYRLLGGSSVLSDPRARDWSSLVAAAQDHRPDPESRARLHRVMATALHSRSLTAVQEANLARLPHAALVVTGQQPALAGGPLHLFCKAMSVVALADGLSARGVPAVPVFWIADEDHDVGELTPGRLPGAPNIDVPFAPDRIMFHRLSLAGSPDTLLEPWARLLDPAVLALLRESFHPSPSEWFLRTIQMVAGDTGLLPLRASWLDELEVPLFLDEIDTPGRLAGEVRETIEVFRAQGLAVPIPEPAEVPFFFVDRDGRRHRLTFEDGHYTSRGDGRRLRPQELADLLRDAPDTLSADALLRPLIQDALLEPLASICGPTELGYNLELAQAYQRRDLRSSVRLPRLRARVLDATLATAVRSLGIDPAALTSDSQVGDLLPSLAGDALAQDVAAVGGALVDRLASLDETATLAKRAGRLGRRLQSDLEKLTEAIRREVEPDVKRERNLLRQALDGLFYRGVALERSASFAHFIGRHGNGLLDAVRSTYDPGDARECLFEVEEKSST